MKTPTFFTEEQAKFIADRNNKSEAEAHAKDLAAGVETDLWTFKASPICAEKSPYWNVTIHSGEDLLAIL